MCTKCCERLAVSSDEQVVGGITIASSDSLLVARHDDWSSELRIWITPIHGCRVNTGLIRISMKHDLGRPCLGYSLCCSPVGGVYYGVFFHDVVSVVVKM